MVETKVTIKPSYEWAEDAKDYGVSHRELEILSLLAQGNDNKKIAEILNLKHQSVKNHMYNLMKKLKVSNGTQALVILILKNMISIERTAGQLTLDFSSEKVRKALSEIIKNDKSIMKRKTRDMKKAFEKHNISIETEEGED